jgi:hypothetical protein
MQMSKVHKMKSCEMSERLETAMKNIETAQVSINEVQLQILKVNKLSQELRLASNSLSNAQIHLIGALHHE